MTTGPSPSSTNERILLATSLFRRADRGWAGQRQRRPIESRLVRSVAPPVTDARTRSVHLAHEQALHGGARNAVAAVHRHQWQWQVAASDGPAEGRSALAEEFGRFLDAEERPGDERGGPDGSHGRRGDGSHVTGPRRPSGAFAVMPSSGAGGGRPDVASRCGTVALPSSPCCLLSHRDGKRHRLSWASASPRSSPSSMSVRASWWTLTIDRRNPELLVLPLTMARLQALGEPEKLAARQRRDPAPYCQGALGLQAGQVELHRSGQCPRRGRVASAAFAESERPSSARAPARVAEREARRSVFRNSEGLTFRVASEPATPAQVVPVGAMSSVLSRWRATASTGP